MLSRNKASSEFWFSVATLATVLAFGATYLSYKLTSTPDNGDSAGTKNEERSPNVENAGDNEKLIKDRFNSCVQHMKPRLSTLPQSSQLAFYALYKQASLGNADDYVAHPPPAYDLVACAKYRAWKSLQGMERSAAMQDYIDKAVHFEFTRSMVGSDDDENYELEGDAVMDMNGMGVRPSTLAVERTKEEQAADLEDDKAYPLHAAARDNQLDTLERLLQDEEDNRDPDELDASGQTALHLAADAGHPGCIKLLVKYGANLHASDNDGISVLQAAVIGGDVETCRLLCALGANPDQPDVDGDTPRECAKDDPILRDLLFRASQNQLEIDDEFQKELQELASAKSEKTKRSSLSTDEALAALDHIPLDLDESDGDM